MKMKTNPPGKLSDGAQCNVIGGVHVGKSGTVTDIKTGKTGHISITVVLASGERFKTLAKNVVIRRNTTPKQRIRPLRSSRRQIGECGLMARVRIVWSAVGGR